MRKGCLFQVWSCFHKPLWGPKQLFFFLALTSTPDDPSFTNQYAAFLTLLKALPTPSRATRLIFRRHSVFGGSVSVHLICWLFSRLMSAFRSLFCKTRVQRWNMFELYQQEGSPLRNIGNKLRLPASLAFCTWNYAHLKMNLKLNEN